MNRNRIEGERSGTRSRRNSRVLWGVIAVVIAVFIVGALGLAGRADGVRARVKSYLSLSSDSLPEQRPPAAMLDSIRNLELQREGTVEITRVRLASELDRADTVRLVYHLREPHFFVQDVDVRGFLDGEEKYAFNQGTSYHMRVGRRYGGAYEGRFELKRSLIKWALPELPIPYRVERAKIRLWKERLYRDHPLRREVHYLPLHIYIYPIDNGWSAGLGGVGTDDFSRPSVGETSWNFRRANMEEWPVPGVLPYAERRFSGMGEYGFEPLDVAGIIEFDEPLVFESEAIRRFVESKKDEDTVSFLLKLGDDQESVPKTEIAFLSSNFGDENDLESKRPELELTLAVNGEREVERENFVLEVGSEREYPVRRHGGGRVALQVRIAPGSLEGRGIEPEVHVRGGTGPADTVSAQWTLLRGPIIRTWDWSQVKLSSRIHALSLGERFKVELHETWVQPGPREEQVPHLLLVAPSGAVHRAQGRPLDHRRYVIEFEPDEVGIWRYGWSFRPTAQRLPGSHVGYGAVFVGLNDPAEVEGKLREMLDRLIADLEEEDLYSPSIQYRVNGLTRALAEAREIGSIDASDVGRLEDSLKAALVR